MPTVLYEREKRAVYVRLSKEEKNGGSVCKTSEKKMPRSSQLLFFGRKWERAASIRTIGSGLRFRRNAFRRLQVIECQSFSRLSQSQPLGAVFRHRQFSSASCHVHRYEYNTSALFPTISPAADVCLIIYVLSASRFLIV